MISNEPVELNQRWIKFDKIVNAIDNVNLLRRIIPATEGLLKKVNRELELKLRAIAPKRETSLDLVQLAAGMPFIE